MDDFVSLGFFNGFNTHIRKLSDVLNPSSTLLRGFTHEEVMHIYWRLKSLDINVGLEFDFRENPEYEIQEYSAKLSTSENSSISEDGRKYISRAVFEGNLSLEPIMREDFYSRIVAEPNGYGGLISLDDIYLDDENFKVSDENLEKAPMYIIAFSMILPCNSSGLNDCKPHEVEGFFLDQYSSQIFSKDFTYYFWISDYKTSISSDRAWASFGEIYY